MSEVTKTRRREMELEVPYMVKLKNPNGEFICSSFCGYLISINNGKFYFELEDNRMLVIIEHDSISAMFPSIEYLNKYYRRKAMQKEKREKEAIQTVKIIF